MKPHRGDGERILAVFIDFENVGLGFGGRRDKFNIERVLERLVEKGKIVAKKAYADWSRFGGYAASLHSAAVELIEIPKRNQTGKNSADIRMCVDAMDLAYSKDHIDTFVIVSGDSDFSPLVSKLKELGKHVIGLGLADSTSELLRDNCDEFIYYEDLDRAPASAPLPGDAGLSETKRKAFALLLDSLLALKRENKEVMFSSMVKDTMKRKKPSFNEEYHGYRTFTDLLEDAQRHGIVDLDRHKSNGMLVVTRFGPDPRPGVPTPPTLAAPPKPVLPPAPPVRAPLPPPVAPAAPKAPAAAAKAPPPPQRPAVAPATESAPPKPRAEPPRRRAEPPPRPAPPPAQAAPPTPRVIEGGSIPLGRGLIDEADFDDDIPSYMPRKATPADAAKPAKPAARAPKAATGEGGTRAGRSQPAAKAERPARAPKADAPPAEARSPRKSPPPPPAQRPAPPPKPRADEDDFGAGLDG